MKYFSGLESIEELRKAFHRFCLSMHPDKGGKHEDFIDMKNEYDALIKNASIKEGADAFAGNREKRYTYESESALARMIERLLTIPNITIEICGSWLWITGDTFSNHSRLSDFGCKFSGSKQKWYWTANLKPGKFRARYSMAKIRAKFGSECINSTAKEREQLAAA